MASARPRTLPPDTRALLPAVIACPEHLLPEGCSEAAADLAWFVDAAQGDEYVEVPAWLLALLLELVARRYGAAELPQCDECGTVEGPSGL